MFLPLAYVLTSVAKWQRSDRAEKSCISTSSRVLIIEFSLSAQNLTSAKKKNSRLLKTHFKYMQVYSNLLTFNSDFMVSMEYFLNHNGNQTLYWYLYINNNPHHKTPPPTTIGRQGRASWSGIILVIIILTYSILYNKKILIESVPEWFPLDANFLVAVLEERGRTLRHHVLYPQSYLHVLEEPLHETQEMFRCSDVPRHCLWK